MSTPDVAVKFSWLHPEAAYAVSETQLPTRLPRGSRVDRAYVASILSSLHSVAAGSVARVLKRSTYSGASGLSLTASPKLALDNKKTFWPTRPANETVL
jgi:hypothetical protein